MEHHRYITFYCQIAKILSCDRGLIYTLVSEIFEKYCIVCITVIFQSLEKKKFAGSSVVKTGHFHCPGPGSIPGQGTKIPKAMWHWTKKKKKRRSLENIIYWASLVVQCLRNQGTPARSLVRVGPTSWHTQPLKPKQLEPALCNEKPPQ